jgi:hypothetical protein
MPDLKRFKIEFKSAEIDKDSIPYKNVQREKQRLANLSSSKSKKEQVIKERQSRWKELERSRKESQKLRNKRNKSKRQDKMAEWEELAEETRKVRRIRHGKAKEVELSDEEEELKNQSSSAEESE